MYASSHKSSSVKVAAVVGVRERSRAAVLLDDPLSALDRVTGTALAEYLVVSF